jgi:hypothetical protein
MLNKYKIFLGSATIILWEIAYIYPTNPVIKGYGDISDDNMNILRMELVTEGFSLIFTCILV